MDRKNIVGIAGGRIKPSLRARPVCLQMHAAAPRAITLALLVVLGSLLSCIGSVALAADPVAQIEAADLSRFALFVDWPDDAFVDSRSAIALCLFAADSLAALASRAAAGLKVGPRSFVVRRVTAKDSPLKCNILYLGSTDSIGHQLAHAVANRPVLLVAKVSDPLIDAVIIFAIEEDRVRFDVNEAAAARDRLVISSKLLALARNVRSARGP